MKLGWRKRDEETRRCNHDDNSSNSSDDDKQRVGALSGDSRGSSHDCHDVASVRRGGNSDIATDDQAVDIDVTSSLSEDHDNVASSSTTNASTARTRRRLFFFGGGRKRRVGIAAASGETNGTTEENGTKRKSWEESSLCWNVTARSAQEDDLAAAVALSLQSVGSSSQGNHDEQLARVMALSSLSDRSNSSNASMTRNNLAMLRASGNDTLDDLLDDLLVDHDLDSLTDMPDRRSNSYNHGEEEECKEEIVPFDIEWQDNNALEEEADDTICANNATFSSTQLRNDAAMAMALALQEEEERTQMEKAAAAVPATLQKPRNRGPRPLTDYILHKDEGMAMEKAKALSLVSDYGGMMSEEEEMAILASLEEVSKPSAMKRKTWPR